MESGESLYRMNKKQGMQPTTTDYHYGNGENVVNFNGFGLERLWPMGNFIYLLPLCKISELACTGFFSKFENFISPKWH